MSSPTDVLIAGGGPAGTHLAIRLGRLGFAVCLLDRSRFPRRKTCGEFLSPECLPLLDQVGLLASVEASGSRRLSGMRLVGYGHTARGTYGPVGAMRAPFTHGYALRRELLDELALRAAERTPGVTVLERTRVVDVVRGPSGEVLGVMASGDGRPARELRARFTIGADGLRSRVAARLHARRAVPWLDKFAIAQRYSHRWEGQHAEVHVFEGGYFAVAPVDSGLVTLNLVVDRSALPRERVALDELVTAMLAKAPLLRERLAGAVRAGELSGCGPLAGTTTRQAWPGAALVGDACGYVDPITGEGLYYAMRGAALLSDSLAAALHARRHDAGALAGYLRARRREFGPRLWLARILQRSLRSPALSRALLGTLAKRSGLMDLLVAVTGEAVPARELLRPGVWWNAWRGREVV